MWIIPDSAWAPIPAHCRPGLELYIREGVTVGSFLEAVLCNDLRRAVECADIENRAALPNYVVFLFNYAPATCWGSRERFQKWIKKGGLVDKPSASDDAAPLLDDDGAVRVGQRCPCCEEIATGAGEHYPQVNHYACACGACWADEWCATVDDECPNCKREIAPIRSEPADV